MKVAAALILGLLTGSSAIAEGTTLRYAIVIGANHGVDERAGVLPRLGHAEREAEALHARLSDCCNFTGPRSLLLTGPTRWDLNEAFRAIAKRMRADREIFPEADTMFGFFFTGHGLAGRLLLGDGAITRAELQRLFEPLHADLVIGMVDACYSGSVEFDTLIAKGVRSTPGMNVVEALPRELLTAKGSVWLLSSGPGQTSYEDREVGGVFTHYFTEALTQAPGDGPGIPLDQIWQYAQRQTIRHTRDNHVAQTPEKVVTRFTARGAFYFSFPQRRSATLVVDAGTPESILLRYDRGDFTEVIDPAPGAERRVSVFPGKLHLALGASSSEERTLNLPPGGVLRVGRVAASSTEAEASYSGLSRSTMSVKGARGNAWTLERLAPRPTFAIGAQYRFTVISQAILTPRQSALLVIEADEGAISVGMGIGYGHGAGNFAAWGYRADSMLAEGWGGYAWNRLGLRFGLEARLGFFGTFQRFDNGSLRVTSGAQLAMESTVERRFGATTSASLRVGVAGVYAPSIAIDGRHSVHPVVGLGLAIHRDIL